MAKVLVIDDETNLRKVLSTMLRRDGYDVTVAQDGEQGLAEFQRNGADVVVTDLGDLDATVLDRPRAALAAPVDEEAGA